MKKEKIAAALGVAALVVLTAFGVRSCLRGERLVFSGTLEFTEHSLGCPVPGRVQEVLVEEGSEVKKGETLATLERYEQAARDLERAESLLKTGGADEQTVELLRLAMEDQQVVSPVDGVVLVKVREAGEVLQAGDAVFVVGDKSQMWVKIFVPEGLIGKIQLGQEAKVRFDGLSRSYDARVSFIATKAEFTPRNVQTPEERATQVFAVKVTLEKPESGLNPGIYGDVRLGKTKSKA